MGNVTVSSKGRIAIPKAVRDALNIGAGSRLSIAVRGQEIVLSREIAWKKLQGAAPDIIDTFAEFKKTERDAKDSGS